jgi:hypothetical protein
MVMLHFHDNPMALGGNVQAVLMVIETCDAMPGAIGAAVETCRYFEIVIELGHQPV